MKFPHYCDRPCRASSAGSWLRSHAPRRLRRVFGIMKSSFSYLSLILSGSSCHRSSCLHIFIPHLLAPSNQTCWLIQNVGEVINMIQARGATCLLRNLQQLQPQATTAATCCRRTRKHGFRPSEAPSGSH